MITLEDLERLAPFAAFGALVWKGSAIVGELRAAISALTTATNGVTEELKRHTTWREETEDRLADLEKAIAVDGVEKKHIEERIESVSGRRGVRATEHQSIDTAAIAARKERKRKP